MSQITGTATGNFDIDGLEFFEFTTTRGAQSRTETKTSAGLASDAEGVRLDAKVLKAQRARLSFEAGLGQDRQAQIEQKDTQILRKEELLADIRFQASIIREGI